MAEDSEKKWEAKQLAAGGGSALALLFMFQSQGIEFMNKNQDSQNSVVIEKTIANTERIRKLEENVTNLNNKIDRGFDSIRQNIRDETGKIGDIVRHAAGDRFTKTEHLSFQSAVEVKFQILQDQINQLRNGNSK